MKYVLIWSVAVMSADGPAVTQSRYPYPFDDRAACESFAKANVARIADYARGLLHLDLDEPIKVNHRCAPAGRGI